MGVVKTISRSTLVRKVLCALAAFYIWFVHVTTRWDERGREAIADAFWKPGKPFIIAFWHGRLLMMVPFWEKGFPMNMLISQHRDGRLIADTNRYFGLEAISGSTSKGGGAALRQMMRALRRGEYVGITPDGPRGPRMRASAGAVALARLAGVPIVPATSACANARTLRSWDRFQLALPFGRGVYLWGEPIDVTGMDEEDARAHLEETLNALTAEADRLVGRPVIDPAPLDNEKDPRP